MARYTGWTNFFHGLYGYLIVAGYDNFYCRNYETNTLDHYIFDYKTNEFYIVGKRSN